MPDLLVLLNGLPGAGKSTLAPPLAEALSATSLSKDAIKEGLAAQGGAASADLGGAAMDQIWRRAADLPGAVVIDSWWFRPRDLAFARQGLAQVRRGRVAEVWCAVPVGVARGRYEARRRAAVHRDGRDMEAEWQAWGRFGGPLGLAPVVVVDTHVPVDGADVARRVVTRAGTVSSLAPTRSQRRGAQLLADGADAGLDLGEGGAQR